MNAQLNHMLFRQRTAALRRAGEQTRLAHEAGIRRRKLRHRNVITCLRARPARLLGQLIVPVMLEVLALSAPAASADPLGQVIDGYGLVPGSCRLLATQTADGIAGRQPQTTVEITG
jgi:hypothetical protein